MSRFDDVAEHLIGEAHGELLASAWKEARVLARSTLGEARSAWSIIEEEETLFPHQRDFVFEDDAKELLLAGAWRSAKSRALCYKLVRRAGSHPGAVEGLCRMELVTLKRTTLRTLLQPEGKMPPVLRPGTYWINRNEQIIDLAPSGGGKILYFGLAASGGEEDAEIRLGSIGLSGIAIDEVSQVPMRLYLMLLGRCSIDVGLMRQLYAACNPNAPRHPIAIRYGVIPNTRIADPERAEPGTWFRGTRLEDNPLLTEDYVRSVNSLTGTAKARFKDGRWVAADNLIYNRFHEDHVVDRPVSDFRRWIIGCDEGYTHKFVLLLIGIDEDERAHVYDEICESGLIKSEKVRRLHSLGEEAFGSVEEARRRIEAISVDSSAADLRAEFANDGWPVQCEEDRIVQDGIGRVQDRLEDPGDGKPRLTVAPRCENTINGFGIYERMADSEKPKKENDDEMDALRYGIWYIDQNMGVGPFYA